MNNFRCIAAHYLRSNRTIETIEMDINGNKHISYIYNFEGIHFRFFENIMKLIDFFRYGEEPTFQFESEKECDEFLERITEKDLFNL